MVLDQIDSISSKVIGILINTNVLQYNMAKPIRATPTLRGQDAIRFVKNMIKEETNPNPKRIAFIKKALNTKFNVVN